MPNESLNIDEVLREVHQLVKRVYKHMLKPEPEWLRTGAAAQFLGVHAQHVRDAIKRGELAAANVGTAAQPRYRISKAELHRWLESRTGGGKPETCTPFQSKHFGQRKGQAHG